MKSSGFISVVIQNHNKLISQTAILSQRTTSKSDHKHVSLPREPTQKKTLRRKKTHLPQKKKTRKRLLLNTDKTRQNKNKNLPYTRRKQKNTPTSHQTRKHFKPNNRKNPKNRNRTRNKKPSKYRLRPQRSHHKRNYHRNLPRKSPCNITSRTKRHCKRYPNP